MRLWTCHFFSNSCPPHGILVDFARSHYCCGVLMASLYFLLSFYTCSWNSSVREIMSLIPCLFIHWKHIERHRLWGIYFSLQIIIWYFYCLFCCSKWPLVLLQVGSRVPWTGPHPSPCTSFLSGIAECSDSCCVFHASVLEPIRSPRSPGSFY